MKTCVKREECRFESLPVIQWHLAEDRKAEHGASNGLCMLQNVFPVPSKIVSVECFKCPNRQRAQRHHSDVFR